MPAEVRPEPTTARAAIVLAGGQGRRLGGVDKALVEVGGVPALTRALRAAARADPILVAGPARPGIAGVRWVQDSGGGPVAGLAAAVFELQTSGQPAPPWVAVLACDQPFVTEQTLDRLQAAAAGRDGAVLVDHEGRRQPLLAVYGVDPLRRALDGLGPVAGASMQALLRAMDLAEVPDLEQASFDLDEPADLAAARRRAGDSPVVTGQ